MCHTDIGDKIHKISHIQLFYLKQLYYNLKKIKIGGFQNEKGYELSFLSKMNSLSLMFFK